MKPYRILTIIIVTLLVWSCNSKSNKTVNKVEKQLPTKVAADSSQNHIVKELLQPKEKPFTEIFCDSIDISKNTGPSSFVGAFGKNYYRIDLKIDSLIKVNKCNYTMYGSTTLKGKTVPYNGELVITNVRKNKTNVYGDENPTYFHTEVFAKYKLVEDKSIIGSGVFTGSFHLGVHLTDDWIIDYDMWEWEGDGYSNYIFDGIWKSQSGKIYDTYFADGKLYVGDLNVGAGEFVPNKKYVKNGWFDYADEYYSDDTVLMKEIEILRQNNNR